MIKLEGVFVPILTPVDDRGEINEPELRRHVSWLVARSVHGFFPNGSTGEFTRFTPEERGYIVRIVTEETGGRVPVIAGAGESNVRETLAACEAYAKMGARAAAIVSPFYYKLGPESVYAYFAELARQAPIDLLLYNIPALASPMDIATVRRLAEEFPRIIGIKDSSGDLGFMMRMIAAIRPIRPEFSFLTGWEATLVPMLLAGCDGGAHAAANAVPELTRRMYNLSRSGDYAAAMELQYRFLTLFDFMLDGFEFPDGFRAATELRGFQLGPGRQPQTEEQRARRTELVPKLRSALGKFELELQ